MEGEIVFADPDKLESLMVDVFKGLGVPDEDASTCAEVLIAADLKGIDSHGINRLKPIYYERVKAGIQQPITNFEIVRENPTTAVIDGHDGMGMVISKKAMELAMKKAKEYGMGMVVVKNSTHYGIAGYYVEMAAKEGLIGITGTNTRPGVAPTFGTENLLGTNPLTFGLPTDEDFPFILDCATSISQRGKIEVYAREGKEVPKGLVINKDGNTMTDPGEILEEMLKGNAALLPLGGLEEETGSHKGYGYSTVVEILSSALQGGPFLRMLSGVEDGEVVPYRLGHFFIAIDISSFIELEEFKRTTGDILATLRSSKRAPGKDRIYTHGEKEYLTSLDRKANGVPLNASLQNDIVDLIKEFELKGYDFI